MITIVLEILLVFLAHSIAAIHSSELKYSKKITYLMWGIWIVFQSTFLFLGELVFTNATAQFFIGFIFPLITQYTIFLLTTKGNLAQRVFTLLTYSTFFCIFMAFLNMVKGTFPNMHPLLMTTISAIIIGSFVYYFIHHVCSLCKMASKNITTGWAPLIFVNIIFLITVILSSVYPMRLTSFREPAFVTFIFLSVSIMSVYPVIFASVNNMSDAATKREVETQNKFLIAQIEAEKTQLAADSQARHDRRHHNLVIMEFANNNDIESIKRYLEHLVESENETSGDVRYCDNTTANTVLGVYERRAKENDILVNISALVSQDIEILPNDLVIVIANLFENAINATSRLNSNEKTINISIKESPQRLLINIENTCREEMTFDESLYGIGIRSVITTTAKYDGMYDFNAYDGIFSANVSLNLR